MQNIKATGAKLYWLYSNKIYGFKGSKSMSVN